MDSLGNSDIICALVIGILVSVVTTLIIVVKIMTLLIHITRRKDMYICPGHKVVPGTQPSGNENVYDMPQEHTNGRQYTAISPEDFRRNNSRTDEKTILENPSASMQEPVYHDIAPAAHTPLVTNPITQRSNVRRSQTTIV